VTDVKDGEYVELAGSSVGVLIARETVLALGDELAVLDIVVVVEDTSKVLEKYTDRFLEVKR
jgi:hypothetical protein